MVEIEITYISMKLGKVKYILKRSEEKSKTDRSFQYDILNIEYEYK
jgi:hypothetical protein